ncbi:hypothetical protein ACOQFV_28355 [Nocardiopsis changdeensis]|uniref:Uncharacterized protein n=1 Tax=Nocardiopsis changdeensis TaxID=2831969 RepID=A0ABX8BVB1_9ACTN|nr:MULTISPECIES: hypothetical protein [Nocardiopsis]QUX24741.1 hypothetical protein KGD84_11030 [Nocardiopsis changdeensis]QYX35128.1 hypothetical protein K1J57_20475 [Nocardiopsis sp. MT53]
MSLRRTVSCAIALGVAAAPAAAVPALAAPVFPATAGATLVGLSVAPDAGGAEGLWGTVYVSSEVGGERLAADTASDPSGLLEPVSVVGPAEATVNTTARDGGRAEAVAELGGLTLTLSGTDTPAVEVGPLRNSITCDFSGNLEWESGPDPERVVTVFGTALTPSGGEASAEVELADGRTAEVTVTDHAPAEGDTGEGRMYTGVTATVDGAELFDLTMGAVSVECPTDGGAEDAPASGERGGGDPSEEASPREEASPDQDAASPSPEGGTPGADAPDEGTGPGTDAPTPTSAPAADDGGSGPGGLPITGAALAGLVTAGVLAVGGGAAAVYLARHRSHGHGDRDTRPPSEEP